MVGAKSEIVNARRLTVSPRSGLTVLYRKSQHERNDLFAESCSAPNRPLLRGINREKGQAHLFRPDCGTWACPYCARRNLARLSHLIAFGCVAVGRLQDIEFVTLTSHEKLASPQATFTVIGKAWNKLNRRYKRAADEIGQTVYYVQIPEQHKNGRWHLHMLCSPPMPERWWKDNARACGFGYQARAIEYKAHGRAGRYMQKYIKKELVNQTQNGWDKSMRRVRRSNNWPISQQMKRKAAGWEWDIVPKEISLQDEITLLQWQGLRVTVADSAADCET